MTSTPSNNYIGQQVKAPEPSVCGVVVVVVVVRFVHKASDTTSSPSNFPVRRSSTFEAIGVGSSEESEVGFHDNSFYSDKGSSTPYPVRFSYDVHDRPPPAGPYRLVRTVSLGTPPPVRGSLLPRGERDGDRE